MKKYFLSLFVLIIFFGCTNPNPKTKINFNPNTTPNNNNNNTNAGDAKDAIATVEAFLNFNVNKKTEILSSLISDDPETVMFGAGATLWKGKETIIKNLTKGIEDVDDCNFSFRDQSMQIAGNIAWFSERGDWSYDYKGQRVDLKGLRISGVLRNENGKWVIVQWHTSIPAR